MQYVARSATVVDLLDDSGELVLSVESPHHSGLVAPILNGRDRFDPAKFGVEQYRRGQAEAATLARGLLNMGRVYIDAPTGTGKSVMARMIACEMSSVILTADHALQRQYEAQGLKSITGRNNWVCTINPKVMADKADCTTGKFNATACTAYQERICPYYLQVQEALAEEVFVTNYHWWMLAQQTTMLRGRYPIFDEAHQFEPILRDHQAAHLSVRYDNKAPRTDSIKEWESWVEEESYEVEHMLRKLGDNRLHVEEGPTRDRLSAEITRLQAYNIQLAKAYTLLITPPHPVIVRDVRGVTISPIRAHINGKPPYPTNAVFLSATLGDIPAIDPGYAAIIRLPSPFPVENRLVHYLPTARLSGKSTDDDYRKVASAIDRLLLKHSDGKGIVHVPSFALAEKLYEFSENQSMLILHAPDHYTRDGAVEAFRNAPRGRVLISPSVNQGIDFPYDACTWQVIAKVPFPNLGDPIEKARSGTPEGNAGVAQTIVQAAGRGVRAEDDSCTTYILDGNFRWFYQQNTGHFPPWFREAVRWPGV